MSRPEPAVIRKRLIALVIGLLCAAGMTLSFLVFLPSQSEHDTSKDYGYIYSGAKSSSVDFVRANLRDDSLLMLGSSELSTPAKSVPQIPVEVFGKHNYGLHAMCVGEAFDQCLWDAIALGAFADGGLPRGKVVLTVGLGQFTDGGIDASTFGERFSYTLYAGFCKNSAIPEDVRSYVRSRLQELETNETVLSAAAPSNLFDAVNGAAYGLTDSLRLQNELRRVRAKALPMAAEPAETPDWAALREWGLEDAKRMSTNNDWGAEDHFWSEQLEPALKGLEGARASETYTQTPEYTDLDCFLQVCDACDVEPLIVISPSMGPYYDYIGISRETREAAYQRIRDVVASHERAQLADFSDREYEQYFLFDIVHFGWTGWIDVEQAVYEFAMSE